MNYIKLLFSNNSILRILQKDEFKKYMRSELTSQMENE